MPHITDNDNNVIIFWDFNIKDLHIVKSLAFTYI